VGHHCHIHTVLFIPSSCWHHLPDAWKNIRGVYAVVQWYMAHITAWAIQHGHAVRWQHLAHTKAPQLRMYTVVQPQGRMRVD
jgi:hypothetical protein